LSNEVGKSGSLFSVHFLYVRLYMGETRDKQVHVLSCSFWYQTSCWYQPNLKTSEYLFLFIWINTPYTGLCTLNNDRQNRLNKDITASTKWQQHGIEKPLKYLNHGVDNKLLNFQQNSLISPLHPPVSQNSKFTPPERDLSYFLRQNIPP
jgi:hypothetical protein